MNRFKKVDKLIESYTKEFKSFSSEGIPQNVLGMIWEICLYGASLKLSDLNFTIQTLKGIKESLPEIGQGPLKEKIFNLETIVTSFKEFHIAVERVTSSTEGGRPGQ